MSVAMIGGRQQRGSTKSPGAILDDAQRRPRRGCGHDGRSNPRSRVLTSGRTPTHSLASTGGERGIRTLEGLLTLTPLAGVRLRPLGHLSASTKKLQLSIT
jgi:hypothetical protein